MAVAPVPLYNPKMPLVFTRCNANEVAESCQKNEVEIVITAQVMGYGFY